MNVKGHLVMIYRFTDVGENRMKYIENTKDDLCMMSNGNVCGDNSGMVRGEKWKMLGKGWMVLRREISVKSNFRNNAVLGSAHFLFRYCFVLNRLYGK